MEDRKRDHIEMAFQSRTLREQMDKRFVYEPLLKAHPANKDEAPFTFLNKKFRVPVWVSSMTGGTKHAETINRNLARACKDFGMGMGLGSCRIILDDDTYFNQFDVRNMIGDEQALYANLGISQIEQLLLAGKTDKIARLVDRLKADGLIVHVNPLQEWLQPEGDILENPPLQTIEMLLEKASYPIIVKEVGQGMGPQSIRHLLQLPLAAIEFGAFGGTNFAKLELMRGNTANQEIYEPLSAIGNDAYSMVQYVNKAVEDHPDKIKCKQIIVSGGVRNYLDGYYLINKTTLPAIYGQASAFLKHARDGYDGLFKYVTLHLKGLKMAETYLSINDE